METHTTSELPSTRPRSRRLRIVVSLRTLMLLVIVIGGGLGWVVYRARVQRETLAAIRRSGGAYDYEWNYHRELGPKGYFVAMSTPDGQPTAPAWLVNTLGVDYFGKVTRVQVRNRVSDSMLHGIGQMTALQDLLLVGGSTSTPSGLDRLHKLAKLNSLALWGGDSEFTGAGLKRFGSLTQLENLILSGIPLKDHDLAFLANLTRLRGLSIHGTRLLDAHMKHLSGLTRLEMLSIDCAGVTDAGMSHLGPLVKLRILSIGPSRVSSAGLNHLRGMSGLTRLFANQTLIEDLAPIGHLTSITDLQLARCPIGDHGLLPVARFDALRTLQLWDTRIGNAGMVHLRALPRLASLDLSHTRVTDACLIHLATLPSLNELNLNQTAIDGTGLAHLSSAPALSELRLADTRVSDIALGALAAYPCLATVDLSRTKVTDAGLKQLASAARSPTSRLKRTLTGLILDETLISDDAIAQLDGFGALTMLHVRKTKITDVALKHLATAKGLNPYLRLDLGETNVTESAVEPLRKARPTWRINR